MSAYTISKDIKNEVAEAIVAEAHPGYNRDAQGWHYVVDTDGDKVFDAVMVKEGNAPWNPWHDNACAVSVYELMENSTADFSPVDYDGNEMYEDAIMLALDEMPEEWENISID